MGRSLRRRPTLARALMLAAAVPLALGCWRLYVGQWGEPDQFVRYEPSPLAADWGRVRDQYVALVNKIRWEAPDDDSDDERAAKAMEAVRDRFLEDEQSRLADARRVELCVGLVGVGLAIPLFVLGFWRRERQAAH